MTATEDRWTVDDGHYLRSPTSYPAIRLSNDDADLFRSALGNEYARRNLPNGVELHSDGTLWALGRNVAALPVGWRWNLGGGWWVVGVTSCPDGWYEVRPPQEPPTVRVPWWQALRDRRTEPSGHPITSGGPGYTGPWVRSRPAPWPATFADADGKVEVLA